MNEVKKYVIVKKPKKQTITVEEFENLKGYTVSPKKDFKYENMIKVKKITIDNPDLIKDFVDKKCKRNMTKVLTILSFVNENDDGSEGRPLMLALNEIEKFRQLLIYKYQEHLSKKEYREYLKKLEILTSEIKLRLSVLKEEEMLDYGRRGGR